MKELLKYGDFTLVDRGSDYCSTINGQTLVFDTASQWKQYIDLISKNHYGKKA